MIEERLSTIKAKAADAGPLLDTLVSEAEVEEAGGLRDLLTTIGSEADAAIGEIPPPCEHEEHEAADDVTVRHEQHQATGKNVMKIWAEDTADDNRRLMGFEVPIDPVADLTTRDDGVQGFTRLGEADRVRYSGAWWRIQHIDPGHHGWVDALRVAWILRTGDNDKWRRPGESDPALRLRDFDLPEQSWGAQTMDPYPYEPHFPADPNAGVIREHAGGVVELFHRRGGAGRQLLVSFEIPETGGAPWEREGNADVTNWYQGQGIFVMEHAEKGVFGILILAGMHTAYGFAISGIRSPNSR